MPVTANRKAASFARARIKAGDVNESGSWSFTSTDSSRLLGDPPNWANYSRAFLGLEPSAPPDTKAHYKYPLGKARNGKFVVYRAALAAIRSRASQQNAKAVFDAAGRLMDAMEKPAETQEQVMQFTEIVDTGLAGRIDIEKKTVHDVAILGPQSANGRTYSKRALEDAVRVFEGARVYVNHRRRSNGRTEPRDVRDYLGRLEGVHLAGDGKVRADSLHVVNENHWPLVQISERDPAAFGLSIDGEGVMHGREVVNIRKAHSVDLVSEPATLKGLFEDVTTESENTEMDWDAITVDDLKEHCGELVTTLQEELTERLKKDAGGEGDNKGEGEQKLQEQIDSLKKELDDARQCETVQMVLREARVSECAEPLMRALEQCADAKAMRALLEATNVKSSRPLSRPPDLKAKPDAQHAKRDLLECWAGPVKNEVW